MRSDKANLADQVADLNDKVAELTKLPKELRLVRDEAELDQQYGAFKARWEALPQELRARFLREHNFQFRHPSIQGGTEMPEFLVRSEAAADPPTSVQKT